MSLTSLVNARDEAMERLMEYRADRKLLGKTGRGARRRVYLARWAAAIEGVLDMYRQEDPDKARAMDRLFGLTHPTPRLQKNRSRMLRLAADFCVSESTLYKWREEILTAVLVAAVENGAFAPFSMGRGPGGRGK